MRFKDHYEPIEIELEDLNGKVRKFKTAFVDVDRSEQISRIMADLKLGNEEKIKSSLGLLFNTDPEAFKHYSLKILTAVFSHIGEELKKKRSEEQEPTSGSDTE